MLPKKHFGLNILLVIVAFVTMFVANIQPALALSADDRRAILKGTEFFDPKDDCTETNLGSAFGGDPACRGVYYPNVSDPAAFATALDTYIRQEKPSSPLIGLGSIFVDKGKQYNVNPMLVIAMAYQESQLGTVVGTGNREVGTHNPFGNLSNSTRKLVHYGSWQEGIDKWNKHVSEDHIQKAKKTTLELEVPYHCGVKDIFTHNQRCDGPTYFRNTVDRMNKMITLAGPALACGASAPIATAAGAVKPGSVYVVGDSIANRARQTFTQSLTQGGWSATINAVDGRPLNGAITTVPANAGQPNGVQAIAADAATIKSSVAVVIELGTNPGTTSDFAAQISGAIDQVRTINQTVPIYWVNIGSSGNTTGPGDSSAVQSAAMFGVRNKAIAAQATLKNFKVINWAGAVFPNMDPGNIAPNQNSSAGLLDSDHVHPTIQGVAELSDLMVSAVSGGSLANSNGASDVCPDSAAALGQAGAGGAGGYDIGPGKLIYYNQGEQPWARHPYGNQGIQQCGCGPTSMAMIIATLTGDTSVTPITVSDYITNSAPQYKESCGSYDSVGQVATHWGLKATPLGHDMNAALTVLRQGGLVLLNITRGGPVHLSGSGHFVVLRKVAPDGQTVYVANPGHREDNEVAFKVSEVAGQLQGGSNPLYGISR